MFSRYLVFLSLLEGGVKGEVMTPGLGAMSELRLDMINGNIYG